MLKLRSINNVFELRSKIFFIPVMFVNNLFVGKLISFKKSKLIMLYKIPNNKF